MKTAKIDGRVYSVIMESYGDNSYAAILKCQNKLYLYHREGIAYSVMEIE